MYLVIRGDRLYAGYSETYTKKNGRRATRGRIAKSLGSKSELLAQDPQALEKLRAELRQMSAPNQATERTKKMLRRSPGSNDLPFIGEPVLNYANCILKPIWEKELKLKALVRYYSIKFGLDFDGEAMLWQNVVECIIGQSSSGQQYRTGRSFQFGSPLFSTDPNSLYALLDFVSRIHKPILNNVNKILSEKNERDSSAVFYEVLCDDVILLIDRNGIPIDICADETKASAQTSQSNSLQELTEAYGIKRTIAFIKNESNTTNRLLKLASEKQGFLLECSLSGSNDVWQEDCGWEWNKEQTEKFKTIKCSVLAAEGASQTEFRMVFAWSRKRFSEDMKRIELREFAARNAVSRQAEICPSKLGSKNYLILNGNQAQSVNEEELKRDKELAGYSAYLFKDAREYDEDWSVLDPDQKQELSASEIVEQYKSLDEHRKCFSLMKTNISMKPLPVYAQEFVDARDAICTLALIVVKILARKLKSAGTPMSSEQIVAALRQAKAAVQLGDGEGALFRPLGQAAYPCEDSNPSEPIKFHKETDLSKILKCMEMKPLPQVGNKNEVAHCLKTRFDTNEQALGAVFEV